MNLSVWQNVNYSGETDNLGFKPLTTKGPAFGAESELRVPLWVLLIPKKECTIGQPIIKLDDGGKTDLQIVERF